MMKMKRGYPVSRVQQIQLVRTVSLILGMHLWTGPVDAPRLREIGKFSLEGLQNGFGGLKSPDDRVKT